LRSLAAISSLYRRIASVTTRFDFVEPVTDADLREFSFQLQCVVGEGSVRVERDPDPRFVLVYVDSPDGGYRRQMIIRRAS
jgi:hypothetical protein